MKASLEKLKHEIIDEIQGSVSNESIVVIAGSLAVGARRTMVSNARPLTHGLMALYGLSERTVV